jgi:hypothetical protein
MAYKMKGHELPGPKQKKSPMSKINWGGVGKEVVDKAIENPELAGKVVGDVANAAGKAVKAIPSVIDDTIKGVASMTPWAYLQGGPK